MTSQPAVLTAPKRKKARGLLIFFIAVFALLTLAAIFGPMLLPETPAHLDLRRTFQPPVFMGGTWANPLGTDQLGRDVLTMVVYGARVSLTIAFASVLVGGALGSLLGMVSGYSGGWVDTLFARVADAQLALPYIVVALAVVMAFGPSFPVVVGVISLSIWVPYARVVRSQVLVIRESEYVALGRVAGLRTSKILFRHIIPNVLPSAIVLATLDFGKVIIFEASLSFLGLGIQPPQTSWGLAIAESRTYLTSGWWIVAMPGIALALTALSSSVIGDALRDWADPRLKEIG